MSFSTLNGRPVAINGLIDPHKDEDWSISIDTMLKQGRLVDTEAIIFITKYDRTLNIKESLMATAPPVPGCHLAACCQWRHMLYDVKHNRASLDNRVTIYVGEKEVPIDLPKVFLTQYPGMFRTALDTNGETQYAEAVNQEMRLPEECPRDFLTLLRVLIEAPRKLDDLDQRHWPYKCIRGEEFGSCCDRNLQTNPHMPPYTFRFCAMVERLALDLPEPAYWDMLTQSVVRTEFLPQPSHVEWAMNNCLDDGCFQRYVAKVLAMAIMSGNTPFRTYAGVLKKHHKLCFYFAAAMSFANFDEQSWFEWSESTGRWEQRLAPNYEP